MLYKYEAINENNEAVFSIIEGDNLTFSIENNENNPIVTYSKYCNNFSEGTVSDFSSVFMKKNINNKFYRIIDGKDYLIFQMDSPIKDFHFITSENELSKNENEKYEIIIKIFW